MLFSLLKQHFELNITDTALKVSRSLYCFTTTISRGVENYFPRLWGTGISDAIFMVWSFSCIHFQNPDNLFLHQGSCDIFCILYACSEKLILNFVSL